jgi:hypothetical protein
MIQSIRPNTTSLNLLVLIMMEKNVIPMSLMELPYLPPLFMARLYRLKIKYSVCVID